MSRIYFEMGETAQILALWRKARAQGEQVCLATVVHVEGSSYRKPGARMLITSGGERAGTISGGCLEAEVSRKAWWLTARGAKVEQYQSSFDEDGGGVPWGLGCGGTVWILLEQEPHAVLQAIAESYENGRAAVLVSRLAAPAQTLGVLSQEMTDRDRTAANLSPALAAIAKLALRTGQTLSLLAEPTVSDLLRADGLASMPDQPLSGELFAEQLITEQLIAEELIAEPGEPAGTLPAYFLEYLAPPPRLTIFGAGDDAQPIARFAEALGWRVAVADGRSHLLRKERFPEAAELRLLHYDSTGADSPVRCGLNEGAAQPAPDFTHAHTAEPFESVETGTHVGELAVVLTHSFDQDRMLLQALLPQPLGYLGILGPRHRTMRLLEEIAPLLGWTEEQCLARLHSPVGLDLGARDPAAIALSIVADLQAALSGRQVHVTRPAQNKGSRKAAAVHG